MNGRAERLGRLLAIRRVSEEMDRSELEIAMALVHEVEAEMRAQGTAMAEARAMARAALGSGDRSEWLLADSQVEVAGWNRGKLKGLLAARTEAAGAAMEKFIESRREHEQVKQLMDDARQLELVDENRKAQSAADDWFLSRRTREAS